MKLSTALLLLFLSSTSVSAQTLNMTLEKGRLFTNVNINGVGATALIDSGAEMTVLDSKFAARLNANTVGQELARGTGKGTLPATFIEGVKIQINDLVLENLVVAALDLSDISKRLMGRPLDMILGQELFSQYRIKLNIRDRALSVIQQSELPSGVALELREEKGIRQFPVNIGSKGEVFADFDLGNGSNVIIGKNLASELGILSGESVVGKEVGGGIGGEVERMLVKLPVLEIAGQRFQNVVASVDEADPDHQLNIGVSILSNFLIVADYSEKTIWLNTIPRNPQN